MTDDRLIHALSLFALPEPYTLEQLDRQRDALLHTWSPQRFANLTNHPKKYMEAYKKAEEMTRKIEEAYRLLVDTLVREQARNRDREK